MIDPRTHDEAEAALFEEAARAQARLDSHKGTMHHMAGDKKDYNRRVPVWGMTMAQVTDQLRSLGDKRDLSYRMTGSEAIARADEMRTEMAKIQAGIEAAEAIYREHRWTRFFSVTSSEGHVHRTMACSTCYATTTFGWHPSLSGKSNDEAVADLGPALCQVCFPEAKAEHKRMTLGQVKSDRDRAERAAAKAARDAVKAAKQLADGEVFWIEGRHERVETVAKCKEVLRTEIEMSNYGGRGPHPWHETYAEAAKQAIKVLLAREERHAGWGATQAEIDKIIANKKRAEAKLWG